MNYNSNSGHRLPGLFRWAKVAMVVFLSGTLITACGPSEAEQKQKQIDELTKEINQIDSVKSQIEYRLDSLAQEKESLLVNFNKEKKNAADFAAQLANSNRALMEYKKKNEQMAAELNKWKEKAERLAAENQQLKEQVNQLVRRVDAAETRAAQAEEKLAQAENKIREYEAAMNATVFVSALEVDAFRKEEKLKRDEITKRATKLVFTVKLGRPGKATSATVPAMKLNIRNPQGGTWYSENITYRNDQAVIELDLNNRKLDKGRYVVGVFEGTTSRFESSFRVQ